VLPQCETRPFRLQNDIVRDGSGRLIYSNPRGELELLTQERVRRGPNSRVGEPELEIKVRRETFIFKPQPVTWTARSSVCHAGIYCACKVLRWSTLLLLRHRLFIRNLKWPWSCSQG